MKLFKTNAELKLHIDFVNGFDTKGVAVNESDVLRDYIKPILGETLLNNLITAYQAATVNSPMSSDYQKLYDRVTPPLARLMFWLWTPEGALNISDNGIGVFKGENIAPASDAKLDKLDRKFLNSALAGLDELLEFLEKNKGLPTYAPWSSSDSFTIIKSFFIQETKEFREFVNISGRRTFFLLRPHMRKVEEFTIKPILKTQSFTDFKNWLPEKPTNEPYKNALYLIQGIIAHKSFARALMELSIIEDERGLSLTNTKLGEASQELQPAETSRITQLIRINEEDAQAYLASLKELLETSPTTDFPGYVKNTTTFVQPYENKPSKPNFYL